jgi:uncharacterized membrane protein SirB2
MGIVLWLVSGLAVFLIARIIPSGRGWWVGELIVTLVAAFLLGVAATALDFGGWREMDWRAAAFCAFGSFAVAGIIRVFTRKGPS